jgi:hypothetical protein
MRVEGSNGSVELLDDHIVIRRKGVMNILTQGIQGDKSVPLNAITSVQFRAAGAFMAGLIQFTIKGGREFRGGMMEATKDENAVLFTRDQQKGFERIRDSVQNIIAKPNASTNAPNADELLKLADLVDRGYLTKDEFEQRKRDILSA